MVQLGDVLEHVPRPVNVRVAEEYREIGIRSHGRGIFHKPPITGSELGNKRVFFIEPGDFVLNIVFAWEGAVAVASEAERGMIGSHRFPTFRPRSSELDVAYLVHYFRTPAGLELLGRVSPGGAGRNRTLSRAAFLAQKIPLPQLPIQRSVVRLVDGVLNATEQALALRSDADAAHEALWSRVAEVRFAQASGRRRLGDLVDVRGGGTPSKANPAFWGGRFPWVSPKDMKSRVIRGAIDHITDEAVAATPAKLIAPGAVLVVTRGMILAHTVPAAHLAVPAAINQDMKALVTKGDVSPEYLTLALWALNRPLLALVEKSSHDTRKLETEKLLDFEIPVPKPQTQAQFVTELDALHQHTAAVASAADWSRAHIQALRSSALARAFAVA